MTHEAPDQKKTSSRAFSKRMLVINVGLVWITVIMSIIFSQAEFVVPSAMAAISALYGLYTGIGYLDFRSILKGGRR